MTLGQVQIDGGVFQSLMAHQQLDGAQIGAGLQQMRGKAMPERVRAEFLLDAGPSGHRSAYAKLRRILSIRDVMQQIHRSALKIDQGRSKGEQGLHCLFPRLGSVGG